MGQRFWLATGLTPADNIIERVSSNQVIQTVVPLTGLGFYHKIRVLTEYLYYTHWPFIA